MRDFVLHATYLKLVSSSMTIMGIPTVPTHHFVFLFSLQEIRSNAIVIFSHFYRVIIFTLSFVSNMWGYGYVMRREKIEGRQPQRFYSCIGSINP